MRSVPRTPIAVAPTA